MKTSQHNPRAKSQELRANPPRADLSPWVQTNEPLFWLLGAGHEIRYSHDEYFYDSRKRRDLPHIVLQLTIRGCGWYERDGKGVRLKPGMALLDHIPGDFRYGYPEDGREPYEQVFVSPRGPGAEDWCRRVIDEFGHVLDFGPNNPVEPLMLAIARYRNPRFEARRVSEGHSGARRASEVHAESSDRYLMSARLYQLLMTVMSTLKRSRAGTAPIVADAIVMVEARAADPSFNVKTLASALGCSREHLARSFQASLNVSPLDYLTQHRLRLAVAALRTSVDKLDQVAARCGFSGANYFCRVFRQYHGISPARARRQPWLLG
ncbi:MAG TPA: AraC family transcriptional regulator [Planctomycetota bacterium]|nr:AraC family transcriptional regulator [Planctomycetota bacterium]